MDITSVEDFLCRTWIPGAYGKSRFLYAIGNTPAEDLLEDYDIAEELDILLLGAGDIRHILKTICGLEPNAKPGHVYKNTVTKVSFLMNDVDPVIIARNAIILEAIINLDLKDEHNLAFIWSVWYNMELSNKHYIQLKSIIEKLTEGQQCSLWTMDTLTRKDVLEAWNSWLSTVHINEELQRNRESFLRSRGIDESFRQSKLEIICNSSANPYKDEKGAKQKLNEWFETGSVQPLVSHTGNSIEKLTKINPTLMRPGSSLWHLHYGSEPFTELEPFKGPNNDTGKSFIVTCFEKFSSRILTFKEMIGKLEVHISLCTGDALYVCSSRLPPSYTFDLIHTSNLSDHLNLTNILLSCGSRLKSDKSLLLTQSMRLSADFSSIDQYLNDTLGSEPSMYPTLYGVKLAEDLNLRKTSMLPMIFSQLVQYAEENLVWTRALTDGISKINIRDSEHIKQAIQHLANFYFNPNSEDGIFNCTSMTSHVVVTAQTLLAILNRLKDIAKGGAEEVIAVIEEAAKNPKYNALFAYWQTVKSALGFGNVQESFAVVNLPSNFVYDENFIVGLATEVAVVMESARTGSFVSKNGEINIRSFEYDNSTDSFNILIHKSLLPDNGKKKPSKYKVKNVNTCMEGPKKKLAGNYKTVKEFTVNAQSIAKNSGQFNDPFIQDENIIEGKENYNVEISVNNAGEKLVIDTSKCDGGMQLKVSCPAKKIVTTILLKFSCAVSLSSSKIQFSCKKGKINCSIKKQMNENVGRNIIPWCGIDTSKLKTFNVSELLSKYKTGPVSPDQVELYEISFLIDKMFTGEKRMPTEPAPGDPFDCVCTTIKMFWMDAVENPKAVLFNLGHCNYNSKHLAVRNGGDIIDIVIQGYCWHQGLPFLAVKFLDWKQIFEATKGDPDKMQIYEDKAIDEVVDMVGCRQVEGGIVYPDDDDKMEKYFSTKEALDLFRKILNSNFHRRTDRRASYDLWEYKPSFIPSFYSRGEVYTIHNTKTCGRCANCSSVGEKLKRCSQCKKVSYCNRECQKKHWSLHKSECKVAGST